MAERHEIPDELIDALLAGYKTPNDMFGKLGIIEQLTKRMMERALQAEMTYHLGHGKNQPVGNVEPV